MNVGKSDGVRFYSFCYFFAAAPAAASIYTDAKIRNGTYIRPSVRKSGQNSEVSYITIIPILPATHSIAALVYYIVRCA